MNFNPLGGLGVDFIEAKASDATGSADINCTIWHMTLQRLRNEHSNIGLKNWQIKFNTN